MCQGARAWPRSWPFSSLGTAPRPPAPQQSQLLPAKGMVAGLARAEVEAGPCRTRQQQHQQHQPQLLHRPGRRHAPAPGQLGSWITRSTFDLLTRPAGPRARDAPPGPLGGSQVGHTPRAGPSPAAPAPAPPLPAAPRK